MKNRQISRQWIGIGTLILLLTLAACRPTVSAPLENTPSPTQDTSSVAPPAENTPTPSGPTDGGEGAPTDGSTDGSSTDDGMTDGSGDGTTDGTTDGSTDDGSTDGSGSGDGSTDGSTDGSSTGDGTDGTPVQNTPTPTPPPTDTGSGGGPTTHVVQPGDTVYSLSVRYGVSVDAIAAANNLGPHYTIYVGQTLVIPGDDGSLPPTVEPPPPGGCSATHVVQPGENLFRIGLRYGYTVDELAAANPEIVNPNSIKVGQVICIP